MRRILVEQRPPQAGRQARRRPGAASTSPDDLADAGRPPGRPARPGRGADRLERHDPEAARLVKLRYFAGLSHEEAAEALGISPRRRRPALGLRPGLALPPDRRNSGTPTNLHGADRPSILALSRGGDSQLERNRSMATVGPASQRAVPGGPGSASIPRSAGASWTASCGDDRRCGPRSNALLEAGDRAGSFLERPAVDPWLTRPRPPRPGTSRPSAPPARAPARDRPVQAARADRRGGHGHGLHGRADPAGPAQGRAEAHQGGDGHAARWSPGSRPSGRPWP